FAYADRCLGRRAEAASSARRVERVTTWPEARVAELPIPRPAPGPLPSFLARCPPRKIGRPPDVRRKSCALASSHDRRRCPDAEKQSVIDLAYAGPQTRTSHEDPGRFLPLGRPAQSFRLSWRAARSGGDQLHRRCLFSTAPGAPPLPSPY